MSHPIRSFKQQAHELVDRLPENATWYDLMFSAGERYDLEGSYVDDVQTVYSYVAEDTPINEYDQS